MKNIKLIILLLIATSSFASEYNANLVTKKTLEKNLSYNSVKDLYALLLVGYNNSLSEHKAWGIIDEHYKQWGKSPDNLKGDPEQVTRMMFALGMWLNKNNESVINYSNTKIDILKLLKTSIVNGTDPQNPEFWNHSYPWGKKGMNQFSVEAPAVAMAFYFSKGMIKFTDQQTENIKNWLMVYANHTAKNNWALFYGITQSVAKINNWQYDEKIYKKNFETAIDCHEGNGWFSDGKSQSHYDDYNNWVFATFLMYWVELDGNSDKKMKAKIKNIIHNLCDNQRFFYSFDGSHPEYGRSITYKFARLASLIYAYKLGFTDIPPGEIKRITRLHIQHYINNGAIDLNSGLVLQQLSKSGTLHIRDVYNYKGSTYWFMQTIAALLSIEKQDKFWNCEEKFLKNEIADFSQYFSQPGWLLEGTKNNSVILYNGGTDHQKGWEAPSYPAKYRKNAYHSQFGCLMGNKNYVPCDNMPVLLACEKAFYPTIDSYKYEKSDKFSIFRIDQKFVKSSLKNLRLKSILIIKGETMLRLSKVDGAELVEDFKIRIGGYAHGFDKEVVSKKIDDNEIYITDSQKSSRLKLFSKSKLTMDSVGYQNKSNFHSKHKSFYLPYVESQLNGNSKIIMLVQAGINNPNNIEEFKSIKLNKTEEGYQIIWGKEKLFVNF